MTTQVAIIIGIVSSSYLMIAASADCDKLENIDNLMENCKIDGKFLCLVFILITDELTLNMTSACIQCFNIILNIQLDWDGKMCDNLDITLEEDDEDKVHGGDYQYIGTIELKSGSTYPFYKQMSPARGVTPLYMYHNRVNNYLIATVRNRF